MFDQGRICGRQLFAQPQIGMRVCCLTQEVCFECVQPSQNTFPPVPTATDATEAMNTIEKAKTRKVPVAAANEAERGVAEAVTTKALHSSHQIYS